MSDRSLDDFVSDSAADDGESVPEHDGSGTTEDESTDSEPVDSAVATATVSPDGAVCEACGEAVTRRWRDDGQYVCSECKEW